jgi:hypothetical protein
MKEGIMLRGVFRHIRRQPVAFAALFFALGGTGLAATTKYLTSTDPITRGDLAGSTYGRPVIARGAVTNRKLAHPSLTITPGNALTGGGSVSLGGNTTLGVADAGIGTTQLADGAVTNGKLANSSLTVASGTGLTGGGSISLGGTGTLSVDPSIVQSRVSGACSHSSAISSINQDGTVSCAGVKVIAGFVDSDGTVISGSGFTVIKLSTGRYQISFPAGTWSGNLPVITVTPFGDSLMFVTGDNHGSDGSATLSLMASSTVGNVTPVDSGFQFIASQT